MHRLYIISSFSSILCLSILSVHAEPPASAAEVERWTTQIPKVVPSEVKGKAVAKAVKKEEPKKETKPAKIGGPKTEWIWDKANKMRLQFRKEFVGGSKKARMIGTCDNIMVVKLNGVKVLSSSRWEAPVGADVQKHIKPGKNVIEVDGRNANPGIAALALKLEMEMPDGKKSYVITDKTWQVKAPDAKEWGTPKVHGKMGMGPWSDVFSKPKRGGAPAPLPPAQKTLKLLSGFQAELLYTVPKRSQGSWVSFAFDDKGRIIASDQGKSGLTRVIPSPIGSKEPTKAEKLKVKITSAQGMTHAFGNLYLSCNGGPGSGLYRVKDTDGDDQYDKVEKLIEMRGGGEHGPHTVIPGPDGKSLYVIAGNATNAPQYENSLVPTHWKEDHLLPRQWDARGHARGRLAPGGWIARCDPDGKNLEFFSMGYRNPYGMAFNADGELFAYDADMEWDVGTPWYRPTRVVHATSGSEFGWRSGTGKWPAYYPDSLPPMIDTGPGSPTGTTMGYGAKFPAKYQKAWYILDWTFGTIYAIHTTPNGSTYDAVKEEFVSGVPLPVTYAAVGPDGAFYFTVGGRGGQSHLYRVTYIGEEPTEKVDCRNPGTEKERALRRSLEAFHGKKDPGAVAAALPHLGHKDRFIRYAARIALEHQPVSQWPEKVLAMKDTQALITGVIALARRGNETARPAILKALKGIEPESLDEPLLLELLRAYSLVFIRLGKPDRETAQPIAARFDALYPAKTDSLNRELSNLLVYLNSPTVVAKTMALIEAESKQSLEDISELLSRNSRYGGTIAKMLANQPAIQKIHYAFVLRNARDGWTLDQRRKYYDWFQSASSASGGASYRGFINNIRKEAMANTEFEHLIALKLKKNSDLVIPRKLPAPIGPGKEWKLDEVVAMGNARGRSFENGKRTYAAAKCVQCHRFDGYGGATGPDLTSVANRYTLQDLAEAIIEPGKVISDQYQATAIATEEDEVITGRIIGDEDGKLLVMTDPFDASKITRVDKKAIAQQKPSETSLMPAGLLNTLNKREVMDLMAYLTSLGDKNARQFNKGRGKTKPKKK